MEEQEQSNLGANGEVVSPEPQNTTDQTEANVTKQSEDNTPFHQHPRWKEMMDQRNQYQTQLQEFRQRSEQYERQVADMRRQMTELAPKPAPQRDELIEQIKEVNPAFAARFEQMQSQLEQANKRAESFDQWRQTSETKTIQQQAMSSLSSLHSQYKVTPEMQSLYNAQLKMHADANPKMRVEDLPGVYKVVHESLQKVLEGIKRADRESYTKAKQDSSQAPTTQPKGKAATQGANAEWSKDPFEARQQMVQRVLKMNRANSKI